MNLDLGSGFDLKLSLKDIFFDFIIWDLSCISRLHKKNNNENPLLLSSLYVAMSQLRLKKKEFSV